MTILSKDKFSVYDASAKVSSGILNGNVNQLGDFDECLNVVTKSFQGKYCLASIRIFATEENTFLNHLKQRILSLEAYESKNFEDVSLILFGFFKIVNIFKSAQSCGSKNVRYPLGTLCSFRLF